MCAKGWEVISVFCFLRNSLSLRPLPATSVVNINTSITEWEGTAEAEVSSLTPGTGAVTWFYQVIIFSFQKHSPFFLASSARTIQKII
jgi:hypothetical protein